MNRRPEDLRDENFDVLVIGGGIFGACAAWSASLQGLSVALIDKGDFAHATSSNHYKFIHGGIRYLQHADVVRVRESSREKSALIRNAPHLSYPMPIVFPTYGHGRRGKGIMRAAMAAYDILTPDRNRGILDPRRRTPNGSVISREDVLELFPGLKREGLTGAALFYDGQMYNPARLVLAFIQSACSRGAVACNYIAADSLLRTGSRVTGCRVTDGMSGETFDVRSRVVVNAAGPWASRFLLEGSGVRLPHEPSFSRDLAFVIDRPVCPTHALGVQSESKDSDALFDRGGRHVFLVPWRGKTLVGVWHRYSEADPDDLAVSTEELRAFLGEINGAYPGLDLTMDDIQVINTGLILFGARRQQGSDHDHSFAKRSMLVDHESEGLEGLITIIGARATVARGIGDKIARIIRKKLSHGGRFQSSGWERLAGGDFDNFDALVAEVGEALPRSGAGVATALAHNYGTRFRDVLACATDDTELRPFPGTNVLRAEIVHAVREEMATRLDDIVVRRTELGSGESPGSEVLKEAARIAGRELGWDPVSSESEAAKLEGVLVDHGPWRLVDSDKQVEQR